MKKRSDGVYHFDRGDYVDYLNSQFDPTYGGAVNESGLVSLQNVAPYDRSPAPSGGFGFPIGVGTAPFQLPGDAGGPTAEGEPTYAAEDAVIAQIASANQIPIEEALQRYYNFIGQPAPVAPAPAPAPAPDDTDAQIRAWFEANPNATAQDVFNVMQANNVDPEAVINAMGFDPESAMATYNTFLETPTAVAPTPTTPAPADDTNILDTIKSIPGAAVDTAKSAADTLLNQIKEFLPFYDQSQVVLNPRTGQATVVFGTPPSGSPVIQAGNLPKSNTNVGITTGVPILDQAINSVLNKPGGLESGSIRDEVIKIISEQAGLDPATTATILGKDLETILATANTDAANTASRLGVDLSPEKKDDVVRDTGTDVVRDTGTSTSDSVDTVLSGGSLTPADLGETPYTVEGTPGTVETGGGGTTATPAAPAPSQGMWGERTKKAGLADIGDVFNIEDMSLANVLSLLAGEGDNTQRAQYYGGGSVNRADSVDEIIRLLRG